MERARENSRVSASSLSCSAERSWSTGRAWSSHSRSKYGWSIGRKGRAATATASSVRSSAHSPEGSAARSRSTTSRSPVGVMPAVGADALQLSEPIQRSTSSSPRIVSSAMNPACARRFSSSAANAGCCTSRSSSRRGSSTLTAKRKSANENSSSFIRSVASALPAIREAWYSKTGSAGGAASRQR